MQRSAYIVVFMLSVSCTAARTQTSQMDFHSMVTSAYNFSPHLLSSKQMSAKSAVLDSFWSTVQTSPAQYLPLLRTELRADHAPEFFAYDGAKLLLSLSSDSIDIALAASAIGHCNLQDVSREDFVLTINRLANQGADVWQAAFKILDEPAFSVFFPGHAMKLSQNYSFICCIFPMNDTSIVSRLIDRLASTKNDTACATLLLALWYTTTERGFNAIMSMGSDASKSTVTKQYAFDLGAKIIALMGEYVGKPPSQSYDDILLQRSRCIKGISDERLYEFEELTGQLQAAFFNQK